MTNEVKKRSKAAQSEDEAALQAKRERKRLKKLAKQEKRRVADEQKQPAQAGPDSTDEGAKAQQTQNVNARTEQSVSTSVQSTKHALKVNGDSGRKQHRERVAEPHGQASQGRAAPEVPTKLKAKAKEDKKKKLKSEKKEDDGQTKESAKAPAPVQLATDRIKELQDWAKGIRDAATSTTVNQPVASSMADAAAKAERKKEKPKRSTIIDGNPSSAPVVNAVESQKVSGGRDAEAFNLQSKKDATDKKDQKNKGNKKDKKDKKEKKDKKDKKEKKRKDGPVGEFIADIADDAGSGQKEKKRKRDEEMSVADNDATSSQPLKKKLKKAKDLAVDATVNAAESLLSLQDEQSKENKDQRRNARKEKKRKAREARERAEAAEKETPSSAVTAAQPKAKNAVTDVVVAEDQSVAKTDKPKVQRKAKSVDAEDTTVIKSKGEKTARSEKPKSDKKNSKKTSPEKSRPDKTKALKARPEEPRSKNARSIIPSAPELPAEPDNSSSGSEDEDADVELQLTGARSQTRPARTAESAAITLSKRKQDEDDDEDEMDANDQDEDGAVLPKKRRKVTLKADQDSSSLSTARQLASKWMNAAQIKAFVTENKLAYRKGRFTKAEDEVLAQALEDYRERNGLTQDEAKALARADPSTSRRDKAEHPDFWAHMALSLVDEFGPRPVLAVYNHVRRLHDDRVKMGPWTAQEDAELERMVKEMGTVWTKIGGEVGRNPTDCKDRYTKSIVPKRNSAKQSGPWTEEEEDKLIELVHKHGHQWALIEKLMGGRSATQCRTKWSDNLRKHDGAAVLVAEGVEKLEDEPWKWRSKDRSKLVHAVAKQNVDSLDEIDFEELDDPALERHGKSNLRRYFIRLSARAKKMLDEADTKRGNVPPEERSHEELLAWLLLRYPVVGEHLSETKFRAHQRRRAREARLAQKGGPAASATHKSKEFVDESEDGGDDASEDDEETDSD